MFETLRMLSPDPILGLNQEYEQCQHPHKMNLGIGVYKNAQGLTPIFDSVKQAESSLIAQQKTKVYISQQGDELFLREIQTLLLGTALKESLAGRVTAVMTAGGSAAIRVAAEVIKAAKPNTKVWVSDPTWANHFTLLKSAGLEAKQYPYYNASTGAVDFDAMYSALTQVPAGDIVLLHACCHNPTGADLNNQQWQKVVELAAVKGFIPMFDLAYQGFGDSLVEDVFAIRLAAKTLPESIVSYSCSKNFGIYRERVGCTVFINQNSKQADATLMHAIASMRSNYSMSPYHGAGIVGHLLSDPALKKQWQQELADICIELKQLREQFATMMNAKQSQKDFNFIINNKGMFSFLGINTRHILDLRQDFGVYVLDSSRINFGSLSANNIDYITDCIAEVINKNSAIK